MFTSYRHSSNFFWNTIIVKKYVFANDVINFTLNSPNKLIKERKIHTIEESTRKNGFPWFCKCLIEGRTVIYRSNKCLKEECGLRGISRLCEEVFEKESIGEEDMAMRPAFPAVSSKKTLELDDVMGKFKATITEYITTRYEAQPEKSRGFSRMILEIVHDSGRTVECFCKRGKLLGEEER